MSAVGGGSGLLSLGVASPGTDVALAPDSDVAPLPAERPLGTNSWVALPGTGTKVETVLAVGAGLAGGAGGAGPGGRENRGAGGLGGRAVGADTGGERRDRDGGVGGGGAY